MAQGLWQNYVMILISLVLMYLAIVKKFEPLLLLPIAFGMFIINIPGAQDVVWGKYETPDLNLSLGKNGDGTLEYIGSYVHNVTGEIIYLKDLGEGFVNGYLKDGQVYFFESLAAVTANTPVTMSPDAFALYTVQGYIEGTVANGTTTFA